jgi:surface carbohydrate biosynthesis protein
VEIAIPVESQSRELDGKLLLSIVLAKEGHTIYMGNSDKIHHGLDLLDPDIFISNRNWVETEIPDKIRAKILLLDCEGGVFDEDSYSQRISREVLEGVDHYLAWGQKSAQIARQNRPGLDVTVTGNPRFDLLDSPWNGIYKTQNREKCSNDCLLFATNFPVHSKKSLFKGGVADGQGSGKSEFKRLMKEEFTDAVTELADVFEDENLILRPHPFENGSYYDKRLSGLDNVRVSTQGDLRQWIFRSKAVIHYDSTSGIEAALASKPVFSYNPNKSKSENYDSRNLPKCVSTEVYSVDELGRKLKDVVENNQRFDPSYHGIALVESYIDFKGEQSVERISKVIDDIHASSLPTTFSPLFREKAKRRLTQLIGHRRFATIRKIRGYTSNREMKFPHISDRQLQESISSFDQFLGTSGIEFRRLSRLENVFHIYETAVE